MTDPNDLTPPEPVSVDDPKTHVQEQMDDNEQAAEVALAAVDELADQASEVTKLRADVKELQEQVLRRTAEFQNYRRRTEEERAQTWGMARAEVLLPLIEIFDDLRRALDAAEETAQQGNPGPSYDALHTGVELVYQKFSETLAKQGVTPIEAVGQPFDHDLHAAMMQQPAPDDETPSGTVLAEVQRGYRLGDRVLRHAQVIVAE